MRKTLISLIIVLALLAATIVFLIIQLSTQSVTASAITREYSYTKAICTNKNFCQDYIIVCNGQNMISKTPIENATLQNSLSWTDPRSQEAIDSYCS
jgi:hypothetical protein